MISPQKALHIVLKNCVYKRLKKMRLNESLGYFLAEDVASRVFLPHWDNSAMDGFALRSRDTAGSGADRPAALKIIATIQAGDGRRRSLNRGEAARIMTGAPVPANADAILVKEDAVVAGNRLMVAAPVPPEGMSAKKAKKYGRVSA